MAMEMVMGHAAVSLVLQLDRKPADLAASCTDMELTVPVLCPRVLSVSHHKCRIQHCDET